MKDIYLQLKYKPRKDKEIIVTFYLESLEGLKKAAVEVAAESSIGTWTELSTMTDKIQRKLSAKIFYLDQKKKIIKIAYPLELFELGNIPQLLSSVAGNIFSMKVIKNLRLLDIEFPDKYINSFTGPKYGLPGIRKIFKIKKRPLVGAIMKPKVGLDSKTNAKYAYEMWLNGVDLIKDDENLTDQNFNKFKNRVTEVIKMQKKAEKETGNKKVYVFNVTAPSDEMLKRAKFAKQKGGDCVMVDIIATGLDNVQFLRDQNLSLIIHGHRAGHSLFTRDKRHGMTMLVMAKLARLAGIDELHTGTVVGKMEGDAVEVKAINSFLKKSFGKLKPVMPIASGGLHPALVPKLVKILGNDLIINFGGGLHGHPDGSAAGARACFAAVEATTKKINLKKYSKNYPDLKMALDHWN
nr:RuBisCO long chain, Form III-c [uncultured bacterium]